MSAISHPWPATAAEAIALQKRLAPLIETVGQPAKVCRIAGVDVAFPGGGDVTRAAVAVVSFPDLAVLETAVLEQPTRFPYVPGLLTFREAPAVLALLESLKTSPDLLMVDGQGMAHPRRIGIASHVGLLTGIPTIGAAKSRLCGEHDEPGSARGSRTPLLHRGEVIGVVLRTRTGVRPLYVSIGHRISLEAAVEWVLACAPRFRLPEPTRLADKLSKGRGV
ncbi:deoxyribonuclease V [Shumkonia mesophila]|uniref:deoxyribonuclease V n=1 Tax=Shumkonia mesophila TaxID=2838854 RepID=UPI002934D83D|nr:deoxyribonuclease V [Shumkonia mesophila]